MLMSNQYHDLYKRFGWVQGSNKNFKCFNTSAHSQGTDSHPSLSVNDDTGQWLCHTCGVKGNFQSYWRDYLKGGPEGGDHYSDFIIDFLGMNESSAGVHFSTSFNEPEAKEWNDKLYGLYEKCQSAHKAKSGKPYILADDLSEEARKIASLPMKELDGYVNALLADKERLEYLRNTRGIDIDLIKCYRIGLDKRRRFVFPIINEDGDLLNMKVYDPFNTNRSYKWMYIHKGREIKPTPINNFTKNPLYFFAGEPDMYCAIANGYDGAVTMGAERNTDVVKVFGVKKCEQLFKGKEVVIVLDADETGVSGAQKLAKSLYPFAKQIKIVDLNKSEINPWGLDPELLKNVGTEDKPKMKRLEKDYTEFWYKNGDGEMAKQRFDNLVKNTKVFTENKDRVKSELYKVTLQESRLPKYASHDDSKVLELIASVGDFNDSAYHYPAEFGVSCPHTAAPNSKAYLSCKKCVIPCFPNFKDDSEMDFFIIRGDIPKEHFHNPGCVKVNTHEILGLIEVSEDKRNIHLKKLCGINPGCQFARIVLKQPEKLLRIRLARDVAEYGENVLNKSMESSAIEIDAYVLGDMDVYPNRSYKFTGVQTQAFNDTRAVLFLHKAEPIATSTENFVMDQDTHDMLRVFKKKDDESIESAFNRRYDVFAQAAGVTGRTEMFLINDLAFFSPLEIDNKTLFPAIKRGWVEVLIGGESRCCKTMISQFLMNHYKVGDLVAGSSAVTRSGLLGGVKFFKGKPGIAWGKIPMNDGGIVVIDELSNINQNTLTDITPCRSSGVASVDTVAGFKRALARTRKIFLSNPRAWTSDKAASFGNGVRFLKNLCFKDEILARFDFAWIVKQGDINSDDFAPAYRQPLTEFTEYQSRYLVMWAHSRTARDVVYEDGIEEHINDCQKKLLKQFHTSTQLVNQEMRLKLARMGIAIATALYSTPKDDWNKIYFKKEHVDFLVKFLIKSYCHENMQFDIYSEQQRDLETLGDMRFMENIVRYVNPKSLLLEEEFTDKSLQQIFCDYLQRVYDKEMYMVDASNDNAKTTNISVNIGIQKLINTLISRRCLVRAKMTYRKTPAFNKWLSGMLNKNANDLSDILETTEDKSDAQVITELRSHLHDSKPPAASQAG